MKHIKLFENNINIDDKLQEIWKLESELNNKKGKIDNVLLDFFKSTPEIIATNINMDVSEIIEEEYLDTLEIVNFTQWSNKNGGNNLFVEIKIDFYEGDDEFSIVLDGDNYRDFVLFAKDPEVFKASKHYNL